MIAYEFHKLLATIRSAVRDNGNCRKEGQLNRLKTLMSEAICRSNFFMFCMSNDIFIVNSCKGESCKLLLLVNYSECISVISLVRE